MSLLTICQKAARKLSIVPPTAITSATSNKDAMLLYELAQEEGYELSRRAQWSALRKEHTFTTLAADSQGAASIPDDYSFYVMETFFDRTQRREVFGPMSPAEWQTYKSRLIVPSDPHFIERGSELLMAPEQAAGHLMAYEYISTNWARSASGDEQSEFLADNDTHIWKSDEILKRGVIWRWKKQKSLNYEDERENYERMVADEIMRDGSKPVIQMAGSRTIRRGKARMQDYDTITP